MRLFRRSWALLVLSLGASGQRASQFNYGEALQKSVLFYDAQRSGALGDMNRINWRGDSALTDGADQNVDLTGGFYDAGDHVKFGFPMASSFTLLAWGAIEYPGAFRDSKQMAPLLSNLRWAMDYLLRASAIPNQLWGQVGTGEADHNFWGAAEVLPMARPAFRITADCPGSDLAAETAAAMASASLVFRAERDDSYAQTLLDRAQLLYSFADQYRGKYSDCIANAANFYQSWSGYNDELAWGAAWLYRATKNPDYLAKAKLAYTSLGREPGTSFHSYKWTHGWDDKSYGTYVLMAELTESPDARADAERWLDYWTSGFNGERIRYTPGGLAWLDQWGSLRYAANTSLLAFIYSDWLQKNSLDPTRAARYASFAERQINYDLGDNPRQSSYVVGFGASSPHNVHHRTTHGSYSDNINSPADSVHTLYGALVGGPDASDGYADSRTDFVKNEVALDYNAAFTGALARMYQRYGGSPLPDFPKVEPVGRDEFFVEASVNSTGSNYVEIATYVNNQSAWPARAAKALTLRYFFTLDSASTSDITLSQAFNQCSAASGPFPWSDQIYYVEVTCANLSPAGQSVYRKQSQFRLTSRGTWDTSNDWSFAGLVYPSPGLVKTSRITLYADGKLIWGQEPNRGIPAQLQILSATELSRGFAGRAYRFNLTAAGGVPPYSAWTLADGALPSKLTLDAMTGVISGIPIAAGTAALSISVQDTVGTIAAKSFNLSVEPPAPLVLNTRILATGHVGSTYAVQLNAIGGIPPYSWRIAQGQLPKGLSLIDATIYGKPVETGTAALTLEVTDQAGTRDNKDLDLVVNSATAISDDSLHLQYRTGFTTSPSNQIGPQFKIVNSGTGGVPLAQLAIRYYFTLEDARPINIWCDWAAVDCSNVKARIVDLGDQRFYLENTFTASAGVIAGGGDSGEIQNRFAKDDWSNFDQSNDYSFDGNKRTFTEFERVTVYRDGVLVWGIEP